MATLAKLLDCLKWPKVAASGRPVGPNPQLQLVADPEVAFGWQGNLFASGVIAGVQAAQTIASVTIPDDCFYVIDATANFSTFGLAAAAAASRRLALQILGPDATIVYDLTFVFISVAYSTVGATNTPPADIFNMRMHLLQGMIVRWQLKDAMITGDTSGCGLALRKLYEENL